MIQEHPRVFVSHASEDKERFVLELATKLRSQGIDAWVDEWEILPGDSLIDKIFEEGIKSAQAMLVVLSEHSVQKPWVREELNAGVVKRIKGQYRLIPVVIDDCEVPEVLKSTAWQKITDLDNYDVELERIVASIYGHGLKPQLSNSPRYATQTVNNLAGLNHLDTLVFKTSVDTSLRSDSNFVDTRQLVGPLHELNISEDLMYESITILADSYYIKGKRTFGSKGLDFFSITPYGFEIYARSFMPRFEELVKMVLLAIVNEDLMGNKAIAVHLDEPRVLIDYVLEILKRRGLIKTSVMLGNNISINSITAKGQRAARNL